MDPNDAQQIGQENPLARKSYPFGNARTQNFRDGVFELHSPPVAFIDTNATKLE